MLYCKSVEFGLCFRWERQDRAVSHVGLFEQLCSEFWLSLCQEWQPTQKKDEEAGVGDWRRWQAHMADDGCSNSSPNIPVAIVVTFEGSRKLEKK